MALRIVLVCLIGVISAAPSSSPPSTPYDTIVVGLGSSGVTAATTLARAGRRVLGLEAQDRIGGRVHTVSFGDGIVEMGGEWIHGDQGSRVYDLAIKNNISTLIQSDATDLYLSDGKDFNKTLVNELQDVFLRIVDEPADEPEAVGTYVTRKWMEYVTKKYPELLNDHDFIAEFLAMAELRTNALEAASSWNDLTNKSPYENLGGSLYQSWHRHGYKTFLELMLNTYNGGPGLSNLEIKLQTEVTSISVPQRPEERVVVICRDGSLYEADSVIVTVSLGVLKAKHSSLFTSLPTNKLTAIDKIGMGLLDKIVLSFDQPWWPRNTSTAAFLWKGEDKRRVEPADLWITKTYGISTPMGSSNTLTLWTSGESAKEVETLSEDLVKRKSMELLQRFIGDSLNITVPQPTGIKRSSWWSNPYTRGSYSFDNILTPQFPDARGWLGAPLTDSAGAPRVLFAGEATNVVHYGTVHGASETGFREASKLLAKTETTTARL